jgi:hypothetical protein
MIFFTARLAVLCRLVLCLVGLLLPADGRAADRLILRNLDILTDCTVTALDEDGLVLDRPFQDRGRITWDEVERGRVALDQPRFDKLLAELGQPLYRVRQRLKIGDYQAAGEFAERLYPRFAERKSQTAYLICQATMWSRLAAGQREGALEPYLRCYELLRSHSATGGNLPGSLPGSRRLKTDAATAISPEILPVWFDAAAAKAALPAVEQAIRSLPPPRAEGVYIYYASLAIAAGQLEEADRVLPLVTSQEHGLPAWRDVVLAEREAAAFSAGEAALSSGEAALSSGEATARLRLALTDLAPDCRAAALYTLGQADLLSPAADTERDGLLALLTLPAAYGREQPELAAAGLYRAAEALVKLKDDTGAAAVRRELAHHYAGTWFGAKLRTQRR